MTRNASRDSSRCLAAGAAFDADQEVFRARNMRCQIGKTHYGKQDIYADVRINSDHQVSRHAESVKQTGRTPQSRALWQRRRSDGARRRLMASKWWRRGGIGHRRRGRGWSYRREIDRRHVGGKKYTEPESLSKRRHQQVNPGL